MAHRTTGVALAGGGPLGAIYELGVLVALDETLRGVDLNDCEAYVGVSSGSFLAAGLANGLTPRVMHARFIESETADDPFEPELLLRPATGEYRKRLAQIVPLFLSALTQYLDELGAHGFMESFQRLGRALPTGLFDNAGIGRYLERQFTKPGRTNDFRRLKHKLFLVATDLDSGQIAPFGAPGLDDVPISRAVQASAALPGLFPPVKINGRWYVDGVLKKTVHASLALQAGVKLLFCINTLVPFDSDLASQRTGRRPPPLIEGGLPQVLSQTFRAVIHSRMEVGMSRYRKEFPDADVVLFEPERGDAEMFFTNVFSYADRRRLAEHAYQHTRAELKRRYQELAPIFARHGVMIDRQVLEDESRTLIPKKHRLNGQHHGAGLVATACELDQALNRLESIIGTAAA